MNLILLVGVIIAARAIAADDKIVVSTSYW